MMLSCSAYYTQSNEYLKAENNLLNEYEQTIYRRLLRAVKDFEPDPEWIFIHHENLDLYGSYDEAIKHLRKSWGGGVDFQNYIIIGKEAYFKSK
jgi:hypothetical protein